MHSKNAVHFELLRKIGFDKNLHELITINVPDFAAGVVMYGNIGGILRENIADNLVNGIISFLAESIVDEHHCFFDLFFVFIIQVKCNCFI